MSQSNTSNLRAPSYFMPDRRYAQIGTSPTTTMPPRYFQPNRVPVNRIWKRRKTDSRICRWISPRRKPVFFGGFVRQIFWVYAKNHSLTWQNLFLPKIFLYRGKRWVRVYLTKVGCIFIKCKFRSVMFIHEFQILNWFDLIRCYVLTYFCIIHFIVFGLVSSLCLREF